MIIVGPTPPPYGGQTLMLQALLDAQRTTFADYRWFPVPVKFSTDLAQRGRFSLRKVAHFLSLVARIVAIRVIHRPEALYYTPAGPTTLPVARDVALLSIIRPLFRQTIFHFHAGGVSEVYARMPGLRRRLLRRAYWGADVAIKVSEHAPDDPAKLGARQIFVVPNGMRDLAGGLRGAPIGSAIPRLLYVGLSTERKGILVLLDAIAKLQRRGVKTSLDIVGEVESDAFRYELQERIAQSGLEHVRFLGVLTGDAKRDAYAAANIVCVPTFFESETFGLVAVEAMMFGLPVVATRWRGLVDVVSHNDNGILVEPRDSDEFAAGLERLIRNPAEAEAMGTRGRRRYEEMFTLDHHLRRMREALEAALGDPTGVLS